MGVITSPMCRGSSRSWRRGLSPATLFLSLARFGGEYRGPKQVSFSKQLELSNQTLIIARTAPANVKHKQSLLNIRPGHVYFGLYILYPQLKTQTKQGSVGCF